MPTDVLYFSFSRSTLANVFEKNEKKNKTTSICVQAINRQKCRLILTIIKFSDISNFIISADLHGLRAPEESLNWKTQYTCSQKHTRKTLQDLKCLYFKNTSKTRKSILIYTENNIYLNSWTKFLLDNRQPSKYSKFTVPSHWGPHERHVLKCPYYVHIISFPKKHERETMFWNNWEKALLEIKK